LCIKLLHITDIHVLHCVCVFFTVHTKISVAHIGNLNYENYTLIYRHYIAPHSASVPNNKKIPTYPTYFSDRNQIFFYLALHGFMSNVLHPIFSSRWFAKVHWHTVLWYISIVHETFVCITLWSLSLTIFIILFNKHVMSGMGLFFIVVVNFKWIAK